MGSPNPDDPYLIPGTDILRNLIGAKTKHELDAAEADLSFVRATQLLEKPASRTNDLAELKAIHFHLFQDIFDWAGQTREIDVKKNIPDAEFFLPWGFIETAARNSFSDLALEDHLKGLSRSEFVSRLAFHYEKINYIHPFREGNGRTQRIFWNRLAHEAGWQLDWRPVHGEENDRAARAGSDEGDLQPLITMFEKIVTSSTSAEDENWSTQELSRLSIHPKEDT